MKTKLLAGLALSLLCALNTQLSTAFAQGTVFTYQGRLNTGGLPVGGLYDFRFRLDADPLGNTILGTVGTNAIPVTNGLFITTIDFGPGFYNGSNYWLEVDVRTNAAPSYTASYTVLTPFQSLTPTPYAVFAETASNVSGTISTAQLSGTLANGNLPPNPTFLGTVSANTLSGDTVSAVTYLGSGASLSSLNASSLSSGIVPLARLSGITSNQLDAATWQLATNTASLNGMTASNFWQTGGNNVAAGQFLGSTNNQPVEIWANGVRALRLEPAGTSVTVGDGIPNGAPNVVGGSPVNYVAAGVVGAVIGGGGTTNYYGPSYTNSVAADFGTIGGGSQNSIQTNAYYSVLGGGQNNSIQTNAIYSIVGGGFRNSIQPYAYYSVLGGGYNNSIQTDAAGSFLGGGSNNSIQTNAAGSFLGGGDVNSIQANVSDSVLGGGDNNSIQTNASYSVLGGGQNNSIQTNAHYSFVGGGFGNTIQANASDSVIGGGEFNYIQPKATHSFIGGGYENSIQTNADHSVIGGGYQNFIQLGAFYSCIGGGQNNYIQSDACFSFLGGGYNNYIQTNTSYAVVVGGQLNMIQTNANNSMIGGGQLNTIQPNATLSTIAGGFTNTIQAGAYDSTIGGGDNNVISAGAYFSTIAGGVNNVVGHAGSTVPGGNGNGAIGINTFAAGTFAQATNDGSFVLSDQTYVNFYSTAINQFSARFGGGYRFFTGGSVLFTNGGAGQSVSWTPGSGSWSFTSDRNTKDRFAAVDAQSVLQKVAQLPVSEWSYKGYDQRHIGAMAQDFHALFPLNENDKVLNDADLHGVELASIQALNQKVEEKDAEIADLKARLEKLEQLISAKAGETK